jgi:hypothetical protein
MADDLCDLCHTSGVHVSRTTYCGKTMCDECFAGAKRHGTGGIKSGAKKRRSKGSH